MQLRICQSFLPRFLHSLMVTVLDTEHAPWTWPWQAPHTGARFSSHAQDDAHKLAVLRLATDRSRTTQCHVYREWLDVLEEGHDITRGVW